MTERTDTPKVSILIPVYNREEFIAECIQSALNQTYKNLEIIIADNSSDDGTWEICQHFAALDRRIRIFQNSRNIGPVKNWQKCIIEAKGEIIKFLFSDDIIFPEFLESTVPYLHNSNIGFVSTAVFVGKEKNDSNLRYLNPQYPETIPSKDYIRFIINDNFNYPVSPGAAIFRKHDAAKNLIDNIPSTTRHDFSVNGAGPDIILFLLTAIDYNHIVMIKEPLAFFRIHPASFTVKNQNNAVREGYSLALEWFLREKNFDSLYIKFLSQNK